MLKKEKGRLQNLASFDTDTWSSSPNIFVLPPAHTNLIFQKSSEFLVYQYFYLCGVVTYCKCSFLQGDYGSVRLNWRISKLLSIDMILELGTYILNALRTAAILSIIKECRFLQVSLDLANLSKFCTICKICYVGCAEQIHQ